METKIIVLPQEINELAIKISEQKQEEVRLVLNQIFTGTDEWERQIESIEVNDVSDTMGIKLADTARLNVKHARLNAMSLIKTKRDDVQYKKLEFDIEDKLWLKTSQIVEIKFKAIEEKAEWKANFVKRFEAEQKELRTQNRILEVSKFAEINRFEFENMNPEIFNNFLSGLKSTFEAKIEAEKLEKERIEKERLAEKERIEAQRIENENLKIEAEKREKEIEAERKANEEKLRVEREKSETERKRIEAENNAKLKIEQVAKAKLEAELKAKNDAEIKAENERKEAELKAQKEAEKNAKAPIKKQLSIWVDSFEIPFFTIENDKAKQINAKFEAFKKWAKNEIENI